MAFLAGSTKTASSQPDAEPLCSIPNKITQHFSSLKVPFAAFKMVIMTRLPPLAPLGPDQHPLYDLTYHRSIQER